MDIHKPGTPHSWREFAKEIGIIVVSVLIALGAEQAVQSVHWDSEVRAERKALHAEIADTLDGVISRRDQEPCVKRRLTEIALVFARHKAGAPLGLLGPVGRPVEISSARGTWDIALAGQALAHMPLKEKLELSNAFASYQIMEKSQAMEGQAWVRLSNLDVADLLEAADWAGLREAYAQARAADQRLALLPSYILRTSSAGVQPKGVKLTDMLMAAADLGICRPLIARGA